MSFRISGTNDNTTFFCNCGDSESQSSVLEDPLPGMLIFCRSTGWSSLIHRAKIYAMEYSVFQQFGGSDIGLRDFPGLKRKLPEDLQEYDMESSTALFSQSVVDLEPALSFKRIRLTAHKPANCVDNPPGRTTDDGMEIGRHSSPMCSSKSPCAVEGCLSKGFAGLFSTRGYLQLDRERRVSFT